MSLHISDTLILPDDYIGFRGVFDLQPPVLESFVSVLLTMDDSLPPRELRVLVELISGAHTLELGEGHHCFGPTFAHVLLHLPHDNLTLLVDGFDVFRKRLFFSGVKLNMLLKFLLFMEKISHPHHVVHFAVITHSECDVHQIVLVLIGDT